MTENMTLADRYREAFVSSAARAIHNALFDYQDDIERLQSVAAGKGKAWDARTCCAYWMEHSEGMFASWMTLPESDEAVWSALENASRSLEEVSHDRTR